MSLLLLAFSYLRFSSPQQATGDSVRRQVENRRKWLDAHPNVQLDNTLVMTDAGRSAFRRKNWDTYALARFVEHIKAGRVEPGSYLLVENLDRLSREDAGEATELFLSIVNKGIIIVQLSPVVMEFRRPVNVQSLMFAIVELSRGHSESAMKSERLGSAWAEKKACAVAGKPQPPARDSRVAGTSLVTHRLPGWIEEKEGKPVLIPERADVVRRVFALARDGDGVAVIAKKLNAEQVPVLGRTTFKGRPVVWAEPVVYHLLTARTVLGEYQPCTGRGSEREPCGEPVSGYYPRVIEPEVFYEVQGILKSRAKVGRGRRGSHVNVFAGLLVDARDGGSLTYKHLSRRPPTLIPVGAKQGRGTPWSSFPASVFEAAVVSKLAEIQAADVWGNGDAVHKVETLAGRLAETDNLVKLWTAKMDDPSRVDIVADKLAELNRKRKALAEELADAQREAAKPLSESWGEFRGLADLLAQDGSDELRTKVRAALRRAIESVTCLFMTVAAGRLAAVQIHFHGSDRRRDYLILSRQARSNGLMQRPARWWVRSFADLPGAGELDLRTRKDALKLEAVLAAAELEAGD